MVEMAMDDGTLAGVTARAGLPGSVDERRYAPGQGEQTEQQLRTLVEGVPNLVWRSCDRGLWTWSSPQWLAYTGQTQEGSHGRDWLNAVHPADRKRTILAWEAAVSNGELDVEFRVHRASDSAWVWHRTMSRPARDEAGRIIDWLGSTTEIQGYKDLQAQQEGSLAAVERRVRDLEEASDRRRRVEERLLHAGFDASQPEHRKRLDDALAIVQAQLATGTLVAVRDSAGRLSVGVP